MEHSYARRGYTLIELLVVLAIILVITALTVTSQGAFNKTLVLANTAYDIALTIRSAENFGSGGRAGAVSGVAPDVGYGVDFKSTTPGSFILFADTDPPPSSSNCHGLPPTGAGSPDAQPGDCVYTTRDTTINNYVLGNGIYVNDICAANSLDTSWSCSLQQLDIVFTRMGLNVFFRATNGSTVTSYTKACLTIASPSAPAGPYRYISVASSGEIGVRTTPCPL